MYFLCYILAGDFMPSIISIAYLGDAVYELYIRKYLTLNNFGKMKDIQKMSLNYVSASSQRRILEYLILNNILSEEEIALVKNGRNAKGGKSKSTDIVTYRLATGLEYLIGHLYINGKINRIDEIMEIILGGNK